MAERAVDTVERLAALDGSRVGRRTRWVLDNAEAGRGSRLLTVRRAASWTLCSLQSVTRNVKQEEPREGNRERQDEQEACDGPHGDPPHLSRSLTQSTSRDARLPHRPTSSTWPTCPQLALMVWRRRAIVSISPTRKSTTRSNGSNPKAAATEGRRFEFALMS